jgi:PDZ domain-containing protein
MFTLEIMNQLTEEDLTDGRRIAGTGTIARDGTVGGIGGVQQKVFGAIDAGAVVVLVPASNYEDALEAAGDEIVVVRVETIDDALEYLDYS